MLARLPYTPRIPVQNNNYWILPVCVVLGVGAFGVAYVVMPDNKKDVPPAAFQAAAAENPGIDPVEPARQEAPKIADPVKSEPAKQEAQPTPKVQRPSYRVWKLPTREKQTGLHTYDVKEITISEDGTQILTKSGLEVHCMNIVTGRVLQTFKPAKPLWAYQKPNTDFTFISPDAKYVFIGSESRTIDNGKRTTDIKEIAVYNASSGTMIGRGKLDERTDMYRIKDAAAFSARGDYLLLPTYHHADGVLIQAIACNSGAVTMLKVPPKKQTGFGWELTLAVPQAPTLLVERRGGSVAAFDLLSGTEKRISALTVDPWTLNNRGVLLSPDGKLVLSQGLHSIQICDWQANRLVLETKIGEQLQSYDNGQFTPDGKRFLVQWKPNFKIYAQGLNRTFSHIWLYDIASKKQIAEFTPEKVGLKVEMDGLTISRDGKTLVWANESGIFAMDFKSVFGIDPLPPAARPAGADVLPLK